MACCDDREDINSFSLNGASYPITSWNIVLTSFVQQPSVAFSKNTTSTPSPSVVSMSAPRPSSTSRNPSKPLLWTSLQRLVTSTLRVSIRKTLATVLLLLFSTPSTGLSRHLGMVAMPLLSRAISRFTPRVLHDLLVVPVHVLSLLAQTHQWLSNVSPN